MPEVEELLERWRAAALITASQADAIRSYEERAPAPAAVAPPPEPPAAEPPPPEPPAPLPRPAPREAGRLPSFGLGADLSGVDLTTLGAVLAALALLALLANIFAVIADFLVGPGTHVAGTVEDILHLVASVCGLVGGLRLMQGRDEGKGLVYWSLGINLVATLLLGGRRVLELWTLVNLATWVVLLVLTWRAHYRGRYRYF